MSEQANQKFDTGAQRGPTVAGGEESQFPPRYDLLLSNLSFMKRMAETYGEGALKYGDDNWRKGMPEKSLINHFMAHLVQHLSGDRKEDHLAHMCWGVMTLMWMQENMPAMLNLCKLATSGTANPVENKTSEVSFDRLVLQSRVIQLVKNVQIREHLAAHDRANYWLLHSLKNFNPDLYTEEDYKKVMAVYSAYEKELSI